VIVMVNLIVGRRSSSHSLSSLS